MINTTLLITIKENYLSLYYIIKGINYTNPFIGLDKNFNSFYFFFSSEYAYHSMS